MSTETALAFVSCPPEKAEALAQTLVEARLAACVNIVPAVTSVYRWKEAVHKGGESLLIIKTAQSRIEALKSAVLQHHPYELPEFITVNLTHGHAPYLQWLLDSTQP